MKRKNANLHETTNNKPSWIQLELDSRRLSHAFTTIIPIIQAGLQQIINGLINCSNIYKAREK